MRFRVNIGDVSFQARLLLKAFLTKGTLVRGKSQLVKLVHDFGHLWSQ